MLPKNVLVLASRSSKYLLKKWSILFTITRHFLTKWMYMWLALWKNASKCLNCSTTLPKQLFAVKHKSVIHLSDARTKKGDEKLCCKVSTGTHQTHRVLNNTKVTTKSAVSFLFPVHTGSCLFAWSRRRSCWGCVGRRRKSWRPSPASTPVLNPRPGPGSMTSSASSKSAYWTSRRRRCGSSRNSCRLTNARTQWWKRSWTWGTTVHTLGFSTHSHIYIRRLRKGTCGQCHSL